MANKFTHLSSLVFNKPLLVTQDYAETVAVVLSDRLEINAENLQIKSEAKPQRDVIQSGNVRVIPIVGSMSHRATGIEAMSGMTSYTDLQKQFESAFNDPSITSILMDIDSPGGSVAGAFDFRDYLMENKGRKPVYALARDNMCSAAYLIGSTADKVYATQTARVGSVGVVAMHLDRSEKNKKEGLKPTFITAGEYKVAGNPHEALEGKALEYLQSSVNESYGMFIKAVAEARNLSEKEIRGTEAKIYSGVEAEKIGLVDGIRTYESVLKEMSTTNFNGQGNKMEKEQLNTTEGQKALVAKLTTDNEVLRKQVLGAGFKITADGLVPLQETKEFIEVEGEKIDASLLPDTVVKALKNKAKAELSAKATAQFPNLKANVAEKLYVAFGADEDMKEALASFNTAMGNMMEETGNAASQSLQSAQDKFDSLVKINQETTGGTYLQAYANVSATDVGKKLIQEIYKEKE